MKFQYIAKGACAAAILAAVAVSGNVRGEAAHPQQESVVSKPVAAAAPASPSAPAMTADDLSAYLDGLVPMQLKRENIAGATVIVVKDGKVLVEKGYGFSDVEKRTPVTPQTLFRPGSISKLFTWTAVMQQVEAGKIDLDRDINDYLDFKIPATYPKPITMRNLMTHTPGFEEAVKDLIVTKGAKPISIGEYLKTHMPQRVYPPGTTPAYSNYGATLAGYIVERVSGMPFDDYVEKNIFLPLGMTHTSFRQPLPAQLLPMMSSGYALGSGDSKPYEVIAAEPAGSSATSAEDISHFMFAHLQDGEYNGVHILKPETVALMHSAQFAVDPALPHMCLGFYEQTRNGHRMFGHGGDTQYFHSDLFLMPDQNLGFFVSYNSGGRGETEQRQNLFNAFLDRYYPYSIPAGVKQPNPDADAKLVAGEYITSRRPVTNILSFISFLENVKVTPGKDGTIVIPQFKGINQVPKKWEEIGPLLYREKNGQDLVGFTKDADGRYVLSMDYPFMDWTRIGVLDSKNFNIFLVVLVIGVFFLTVIFWPISAWIRKHYNHPLQAEPRECRLRLAIRLIAAIDLIYSVCWFSILIASGGSPLFDSSFDGTLRAVQIVGWIGSLGTLLILLAVVKTWKAPGEWWLSHVGNIAIALSAVSFSWFLWHWHLLHFSLLY
ncbi:MAG: serine hydrolase domain-containing protein [Terracidiphilus sp.]|jgi:CubicO group peptidase (beta-lactamase class C family)